MPQRKADGGKLWFNWPLALGLIFNFAVIAGLGFLFLHKR